MLLFCLVLAELERFQLLDDRHPVPSGNVKPRLTSIDGGKGDTPPAT